MIKNKNLHWFIVSTFVGLYLIVSIISTIHVIDFFRISNPEWLSVFLAIAFEVGAAASLSSIIIMDRMNKLLVWSLFIMLTLMQAMGNTYYAYTHLSDFNSWIELFGLVEEDPIYQKRTISIISGAILPLVSLGFIKSLVDYIRPEETKEEIKDNKTEGPSIVEEDEEIVEENVQEVQEEPIVSEEEVKIIPSVDSVKDPIMDDPVRSYIRRIAN
jgi:hypothetical protein